MSSREALAARLGPIRPTLGRLAGQHYAPFGEPLTLDPRPIAAQAAVLASRPREGETSAEALTDAALVDLLAGRLDWAVRQLESAVELDDATAATWNDLAVALLTRAQEHDRSLDLVAALRANRRALALDSRHPEALFNKALLLEAFHARSGALEAWRRFLEEDSTTGWAAEATARSTALGDAPAELPARPSLAAIDQALTRDSPAAVDAVIEQEPQRWRQFFEEDLLPHYVAIGVDTPGDPASDQAAERARAVAQSLGRLSGDPLPAASVEAFATATIAERAVLRRGHRLYASALASYQGSAFETAAGVFERARIELDRGGSPFSAWADLHLAICDYQGKSYDRALTRLNRLRQAARTHGYLAVEGRTAWIAGLVYAVRADPIRAAAEYSASATIFSRLGERGNVAAVTSLAADNFDFLGDPARAWSARLRSLEAAVAFDDAERLPIIQRDTARALAAAGEPWAGLVLEQESFEAELRQRDYTGLVEALWWRASILHQMGESEEALSDLDQARELLREIPSAGARAHLRAGLAATEGATRLADDPERAIRALNQSLAYFRSHDFDYMLTEILLQRGRGHLAMGGLAAAEADLNAGILAFEEQRRRMAGAPQRIRFFDRAGNVFDEMIRLQLDWRNDPVAAFVYADRSRARALLEDMRALVWESPEGLDGTIPRSVEDALAEDEALVAYTSLDDEVLAWTFHRGEIALTRIGRTRAEVETGATALAAASHGSVDAFREQAHRLHRDLLAPAIDGISSVRRIVFVPDGSTSALPFAALVDDSGRYLIERFEIVVAPSVAAYLALVDSQETGSRRTDLETLRVLVVGDPRLDPATSNGLPRLPGAADEARAVSNLYPGSTLLVGDAATRQAFLDHAPRADLVHLAVHAVTTRANPQAARILLASDEPGRLGSISARELATLGLERAPLVVLSACGAARGPAQSLEGRLDLASPLLGGGASGVLVTIWDADDLQTAALLTAFHQDYASTRDGAGALRRAQMEMLTSTDPARRHPSTWAGFQLIGAVRRSP